MLSCSDHIYRFWTIIRLPLKKCFCLISRQKVIINRILTSIVIFNQSHMWILKEKKVVDWIKCHQTPSVVVILWGGGQYELSKINLVLLITFFIILALTFGFEHNIHLHSHCCFWVLKMSQPFLFYHGAGKQRSQYPYEHWSSSIGVSLKSSYGGSFGACGSFSLSEFEKCVWAPWRRLFFFFYIQA